MLVGISTMKVFENCKKWFKDCTTPRIKLYAGNKHYFLYDKRYDKLYQVCMEFDT
jgi:uncharacterized protein